MNQLISRLQKDIEKLQKTIQKESNELLEKVRKVDLKDNFDHKKRDIEKALTLKLKKLEPAYHNFMDELRKNAKKAGIDIDKIEKEIMEKAGSRFKRAGNPKKTTKKKAGSKKKVTKKVSKVKKTFGNSVKTVKKKVSTAKKTSRKKSAGAKSGANKTRKKAPSKA